MLDSPRLAEFSSCSAAMNAIAMLDKTYFNGRQLHLRLDRRLADDHRDAGGSVFVGNVPWAVTQEELLELFAAYHPLECSILTNMYGRSKGFAIVTFATEAEAASAIAAINQLEFRGRKLECRFDRGAEKQDGEAANYDSVFVSKLSPSIIDDSALANLFVHIGPVQSARLQKSPTGKSKGWGIVTFADPAHIHFAVETMNGQCLPGSTVPLEVRVDRKRQL